MKLALCGGRSGVKIQLVDYMDKHGMGDPRAVFMSWDEQFSLQEAEVIKYFDAMAWGWGAASLPSTKDTPAVPWPTALTQPQGTGSSEEVKRVEKEKECVREREEVLAKALLLALGVQQQQAAPAPADYSQQVRRCVCVCVCVFPLLLSH